MKRRDLEKRIRQQAKRSGLQLIAVREGGGHSVFEVGGVAFTVPRHNEINEMTAQSIMKHLESVLGKGWWR